ncbi:hypothetical protein JMJ35_007828 [Cladonia borealis]|uniref:Cytochrome P450 n=1 Tax=Cladonia borealis TaxID=184061 RepID=A0AA39QWW9_9LECA|nr:hypothetical protein JMJ35_007828 [Cladonia borealis]
MSSFVFNGLSQMNSSVHSKHLQSILPTSWTERISPSSVKMASYLLILAVLVTLIRLVRTKQHLSEQGKPREPPVIHTNLWQFWKNGTQILDALAAENMHKFPHGIFTVSVFGWKIYVVNSPEMTQVIQARSRFTGLGWISILVMANMGGHGKQATQRLFKGVERGDVGNALGFVHDYHKVELRAMSLGTSLDAMEVDFVAAWDPFIESLKASLQSGNAKLDVWEWFKMSITVSVSRGVWGPKSPYCNNPILWEQFWTFNRSYNLLRYKFPGIFARRGAEAREKVVDAFVDFDENGGFDNASQLAQDRAKVLEKTGLEKRDVARMAMSQSVGQFDNSATVSFALLSFILRDPELLARIRKELEEHVTKNEDGRKVVDTLRIGKDCPLLLSTFHEVLRWIAVGVTVRRIEKDYPLTIKSDNTEYFLRKGNFIWGSGVAIHTCPSFYKDADKFDPDRFMGVKYPETQMPDIFRAFGGGGNICLGRHFARTIVPGAVGTLLMAFDFEPFNGKPLCVPNRKDLMLGHATPNPFGNTMATVKIRDG